MSVINFTSFDPPLLGKKGKQNLRGIKICAQSLYIYSYEKLSRYLTFCQFRKEVVGVTLIKLTVLQKCLKMYDTQLIYRTIKLSES